jgi:hypothetical protein
VSAELGVQYPNVVLYREEKERKVAG